MFRTAPSRLLRAAAIPTRHPTVVRRTLSTATPARRSRSWKSSAIRWGIAIAGVYYYSTSNAFADEPAYLATAPPSTEDDSSNLPTIEEITAQSKRKLAAAAGEKGSQPEGSVIAAADLGSRSDGPQTPEEYEEEAESQGAFNPETGEINWDCPCLGGMAHGPCGEQFRAAFSCFVYSTEEPKGMDCIDKFKTMQDCFREHPDVYGSELEDEVEEEARQQDADAAKAASLPSDSTQAENTTPPSAQLREGEPEKVFTTAAPGEERIAKKERAQSAKIQVKGEAEELVPKKWHDTEKSNEGK